LTILSKEAEVKLNLHTQELGGNLGKKWPQ
jgi:hypothetical protein